MRTVRRCWITLNWNRILNHSNDELNAINDELETPNDEGMTNVEARKTDSLFVIRISFVIGPFLNELGVIRHLP